MTLAFMAPSKYQHQTLTIWQDRVSSSTTIMCRQSVLQRVGR